MMQTTTTLLRRLAAMPLTEVAGRGRQEATKVIEAIAGPRGLDASRLLRRHAARLSDPDALLAMLREKAPQRFFAGVEDPSAVLPAQPSHREKLLQAANQCLRGRFDLLGYRGLSFGDPIDWQLDPVSGRRAPRVHWSRLDPLDASVVGDSKVVWELNRHQWVVQMAQAYALTSDEQYADASLNVIESWLEANPAGMGINWASSLEVGYRVMSWSWVLMLLRDSRALTGARASAVVASIGQHASHVSRYLSHYFSPNTHLTSEALALFYAGSLFQEFDESVNWRQLGADILIEQSAAQICADGVHFERSTCYHRYTVETYQQFLLLADRNHVAVPDHVRERLLSAVEFLLAIRQPGGMISEIGDADGGSLVPVVQRSQCDPSGVFAVAASMYGRADFAWAAGHLTPDVHWLVGEGGVTRFLDLDPTPPTGSPSSVFPSGGYAVLRSGWGADAHQMVVDVGPLGCSYAAGHGHADLLSVNCAVFGEPCLVDAGTYCYTPKPEWRNYFRGTHAHNTLSVNARHQADFSSAFRWHSKPSAVLGGWQTGDDCELIDAHHAAYAGVTHRRRVLFRKPCYWVIVDDVTGSDPMTKNVKGSDPGIQLTFQFAPMRVVVESDSWARATTPAGNTLWVGTFASAPLDLSIKCGEIDPIRGWISTNYGERTPAPALLVNSTSPLPWRGVTVLLPLRGTDHLLPRIEPRHANNGLPCALDFAQEPRESVQISDTSLALAN